MQTFEMLGRTVLVILLNGIWQGAAFALLTWLALRLSPRANASTRYAAWTLALAATLIVPIATSLTRISYESRAHVAHSSSAATTARVSDVPSGSRTQSREQERPVLSHAASFSLPQTPSVRITPSALLVGVAFAAWGLAALALIVRLAVALLQLEKLKRDALPLGMDYREQLLQWQAVTTRDRDVRICVTDGIEVPVAVGLFDAMVLLPQHLLATLETSEIDQISLHELAHLLRHDDWTNGLQRIISAMLFFSPAVWFIARQMDIEREVACDDYVLELTGAVRSYAYCLTKMAEMTSWPHQPLAAPGVFITRKNISIRIERLLRTGRAISSTISPAAATAVVVGLAAGFLVARVATPAIAFALPVAPPSPVAIASPAQPHPPKVAATTIPEKHVHVDVPAIHVNVPATHVDVPATHVSVDIPAVNIPPINMPQIATGAERTSSRNGNCGGCDFSNANLRGRDFRDQNLTGSDFSNTNLSGARFDHSNVSGANFSNANLRDVSFTGANLSGCNLENANLDGVNFDGADLTGCSIDIKKLSPRQAKVFLTRCTGCDFAQANLRGIDLHGIKVTGIDLQGADLRNTDLTNAYFSGVDFSKADLSGAHLAGATFSGCSFDHTDLRNVDLSHVNFVGVSLGNAIMR